MRQDHDHIMGDLSGLRVGLDWIGLDFTSTVLLVLLVGAGEHQFAFTYTYTYVPQPSLPPLTGLLPRSRSIYSIPTLVHLS